MANNLTAEQNKQIEALKQQWNAANASGDQAAKDKAHADAEAIRKQAGFSGGADGSGYVPLSGADSSQSDDHQNQIRGYKEQYEQAKASGNQAGMAEAHALAEALRRQLGYSGGADGSQNLYGSNPIGGMTADEMRKWNEEYERANQNWQPNGSHYYANGYSVAMNLRSQANKIRQQMQRNSEAWKTADPAMRQYLHQQNIELEKVLREANGGAESRFNEKLGRWETDNANLGYGFNTGQYNDLDWYRNAYGMTDDQIKQYQNDTDRYHNFVDQGVIRNWVDDSSGFTGMYAQFVNGPYAALMGNAHGAPMSHYVDLEGDGFGTSGYVMPPVGPDGKVIPQAPDLKNNQGHGMDYTRQHAGFVHDGVIMPNALNAPSKGDQWYSRDYNSGPRPHYEGSIDNMPEDQIWRGYGDGGDDPRSPFQTPIWGGDPYGPVLPGGGSRGPGGYMGGSSSSMGGGGTFDSMINNMYDANLKSQMEALKQAYNNNMSGLDQNLSEVLKAYQEQKRQTTGQSDQDAANWREVANAQGLNTGALGQAALEQNNQLQSDLAALGAAQAAAQADIDRRRQLLGQQFEADLIKAQADNDRDRFNMLYQEAVRADQALRQEEQFYAGLKADQMNKLMSMMAKGGGSTSRSRGRGGPGGPGPFNPDDYTGEDVIDPDGTNITSLRNRIYDLSHSPIAGGPDAPITNLIEQYLSQGLIKEEDADKLIEELNPSKYENIYVKGSRNPANTYFG